MKSLVIALCFIGFATATLSTNSDKVIEIKCVVNENRKHGKFLLRIKKK